MRKIIIGLSPLFLMMPSISIAAPLQWQVSEASGEVRLTHEGQTRAAVRGALLASGATITTGAKARAVIVRGEEFVVISPGSQLRVPAASTPNAVMQMIEDFGTAVFRIKKKSTPHFGVQTPYLAAVVKGTTFTVTVGPEGGSVQVTEGAVEVSTLDGGAADLVEPGDIASVGASDLYQLTIEGDASKIIRSENGPAASGVVTSSNALPAPKALPVQGPSATSAIAASGTGAFSGPATQSFTIGFAIAEKPQSLGAVTDGLVEGDLAMEFAALAVHDMRALDGRLALQDDDTPGGSNAAPGQANDTPGKSSDAPGHAHDTPAKSDDSGKSGGVSDNSGSGGTGSGSSADKEAEKAAREAEKAAEDAAKAAEKAAKDAAKDAEKAAKDAEKAAEEAAKDAEKAAKDAAKAAEDAAKAAEQAAKEAAETDDGVCVLGLACVDIL